MGNLIRNIYSWFLNWFGENLYNFLKGWDCNSELVNPNRFLTIGLVTLAISAIFIVIYYIWPRRSRFNFIGSWFIAIAFTGLVGFLFGFGYTYSKQSEMPAYVIYGIDNVQSVADETTDDISDDCYSLVPYDYAQPQVTISNFLYFGLVNAICAMVLFFILSIIIKRFPVTANTGTQHTPWKSLYKRKE